MKNRSIEIIAKDGDIIISEHEYNRLKAVLMGGGNDK